MLTEHSRTDGCGPRAYEAARGAGQGDTVAPRADVRAQRGTSYTAQATRLPAKD